MFELWFSVLCYSLDLASFCLMDWSIVQSGAFKIGKEGCVFLQFAPASSTRSYDWEKKQVISTSVCVLSAHDHKIIC